MAKPRLYDWGSKFTTYENACRHADYLRRNTKSCDVKVLLIIDGWIVTWKDGASGWVNQC